MVVRNCDALCQNLTRSAGKTGELGRMGLGTGCANSLVCARRMRSTGDTEGVQNWLNRRQEGCSLRQQGVKNGL